MVSIDQMLAQEKYFYEHTEEIYRTNARFAMIHPNRAEFFPNKDSLYKAYPHLIPEAEPTFGNFPMLIDIGEITNSIEYRKEQIEKREKKIERDLERIAREYKEIIIDKNEIDRLLKEIV